VQQAEAAPPDVVEEGEPAPSPASPAEAEPGAEKARTAGRGGIAIAGAKVSFILIGFAQQLLLNRVLGLDGYGEVSRITGAVSVLNNVVVTTSIQGVSHAVSSAPAGKGPEAFRRALRVHLAVAVVLSAAFALGAGFIADFVKAPQIAGSLRVVAVVTLLYGAYSPLVGSLNGTRRFTTQAALDVGYSVLRTAGLVGGAALFLRAGGSGVSGAVAGFVVAAAVILPIALSRSGIGRAATGEPAGGAAVRAYLGFLFPLAVSQTVLSLLLQTDFTLLSRFAGQAAEAAGRGPAVASDLVGVYKNVQLFAFLPYQVLISITFILFPMLAGARASGDLAAVRDYTRTGMRLSLLTTGLMCGAVSALGPHVLRFAFQDEVWTQGGETLRVLSLGMGSFAILGVTCAALSSLGRAWHAALLTGAAVALVAAGCATFVPRAPLGPEMLLHSALATSVALTAAAGVGAVVLRRVAGGFVAVGTLVRVGAATAVAVAAGSRLPWLGKLAVPVEAAAVGVVYLGVLVALGEVGKADVARLKQVAGRRR
jgi:stage V sporulation protein B